MLEIVTSCIKYIVQTDIIYSVVKHIKMAANNISHAVLSEGNKFQKQV